MNLEPSNIMVVDDHPPNLKLLEDMLGRDGHRVHSFPRGRMALAAAAQSPPDLILLDITMPEMNGYEVCKRLKSDAALSHIPVMFLSALGEMDDKVKAFEAGGVDYVAKPFQVEEVRARVKTHLELHRLQQALQLQNRDLEETVRARTRELTEAYARLALLDRTKSEFLGLLSHEFRTPLNGLLGVGQLVLNELGSGPEEDELRQLFGCSRERILSLLEDALLLTQIEVEGERFKLASVPLSRASGRALEGVAEAARARGVKLEGPSEDMGMVYAEETLLVKALEALLKTAVGFSKPGDIVRLSGQQLPAGELAQGWVNLTIEGQSGSIPAAVMPKFFELLSVAENSTAGGDLGLHPALAAGILALFGGSVLAENREVSGIRLTVRLPANLP